MGEWRKGRVRRGERTVVCIKAVAEGQREMDSLERCVVWVPGRMVGGAL